VKIWDATPLDEKPDPRTRTLRGHTGPSSMAMAFSADGQFLASGSVDNTVKIWDVETCQEVHTLRGHNGGGSGAWRFSGGRPPRDGQRRQNRQALGRGHLAGDPHLHAIPGRPPPHRVEPRWPASGHLRPIPDGASLGTRRPHANSRWSVTGGRSGGVTFNSDGKFLATAGVDGTVKVWDGGYRSGGPNLPWTHQAGSHVVAFSPDPDGRLVASGGGGPDGKGSGRGPPTKSLSSLPGHTDYIFGMAFSPDGRWPGLGEVGGRSSSGIQGPGGPIKTLDGFLGTIWSVAFSPNGQSLAAGRRLQGQGTNQDLGRDPHGPGNLFDLEAPRVVSSGVVCGAQAQGGSDACSPAKSNSVRSR